MSDMILTEANLYEEMESPFGGEKIMILTSERLALEDQQEQVRQRLVGVFSSAPLYQARAAKDPEYWTEFSMGVVR